MERRRAELSPTEETARTVSLGEEMYQKLDKKTRYAEERKDMLGDLIKDRVERVRRDLALVDLESYQSSAEDEGRAVDRLIADLNKSLDERGESYRYLGVGDTVVFDGKPFRVVKISRSEPSLGELRGRRFGLGANQYDVPPPKGGGEFLPEFLPLVYLFEEEREG